MALVEPHHSKILFIYVDHIEIFINDKRKKIHTERSIKQVNYL